MFKRTILAGLITAFMTLFAVEAMAGLSAADKKSLNTIEQNMARKGFLLGDILENTLYSPADGLFEVQGTIIGVKDNGTAMRVKGLQHSSEGSAQVQSYEGIFNNASYSTVGTLKTRYSVGANAEMDLAIQSPHALLLIAQDGSQTDGVIKMASQNGVEFHTQYSAEELSPKRLIVNRVSTAAKGSSNTSDVTLGTNDGKLYLQRGHVGGGVVFPSYTDAQETALTPVAGEVIFNTTSSKLKVYDGTSWVALH